MLCFLMASNNFSLVMYSCQYLIIHCLLLPIKLFNSLLQPRFEAFQMFHVFVLECSCFLCAIRYNASHKIPSNVFLNLVLNPLLVSPFFYSSECSFPRANLFFVLSIQLPFHVIILPKYLKDSTCSNLNPLSSRLLLFYKYYITAKILPYFSGVVPVY